MEMWQKYRNRINNIKKYYLLASVHCSPVYRIILYIYLKMKNTPEKVCPCGCELLLLVYQLCHLCKG